MAEWLISCIALMAYFTHYLSLVCLVFAARRAEQKGHNAEETRCTVNPLFLKAKDTFTSCLSEFHYI